MRKRTTEEFIRDAQSLWGIGAFDYSNVDYKGLEIPIEITCSNGHTFQQTPHQHLRGHGCRQCVDESKKSLVCGVGINDLGKCQKTKAYQRWQNILIRCYDEKFHAKEPSYIGCTVCPEWHYLSNFKRWFDDNYIEGYQLDKDILVKGNKIYSPETCCFVPKEINTLLTLRHNHRGKYPLGVSPFKHYFQSHISLNGRRKTIGYFPTPEAAFLAYKKAKENYVKELAEKYYAEGKITERIYLALCNYRVEITD